MKKLLFISLFLSGAGLTQAQETLSNKELQTTGLFAITVQGTQFQNKFSPIVSLQGGWIVNKVIGVGLDFNILAPARSFDNLDFEPVIPVGAYGGIFIEPIFWGDKVVHMTVPISMGWGSILYLKDWDYDNGSSDNLKDGDFFKYIEPGLNAELNLFSNLRVGLGLGIRITSDLKLNNTDPDDFNALNYYLTFKFGRY